MASSELNDRIPSQQEFDKVSKDVRTRARSGEEKVANKATHIEQAARDAPPTQTSNASLHRPPLDNSDAMPLGAQHHIASFLSSTSCPFIPTDEIATVLKNSQYINQKRKILSRTLIPPALTPCAAPAPSKDPPNNPPIFAERLLDLPAELFAVTMALLPPADVIALSFTSKTFYNTLNYQLIDLWNLVLASDLYDHYPKQKFAYAINRQRYDICRRLRRDKMAHLVTLENPSADLILCSACTKFHPKRFFTPSQLSTPPHQRSCLATTAPLTFCAHWSETLQTLRQRNEDARCNPTPWHTFHAETCQHPSHYTPSGEVDSPPPVLRQLGGCQKVTKTVRIGHIDDYDLITREIVQMTLEKEPMSGVEVCQHVRVGDEVVASSFMRREGSEQRPEDAWRGCEMPTFEVGGCGECGMMWQFRIRDVGGLGMAGRYELQLVVDWEVKAVKKAWSREWLRWVEGGGKLMELL